MPPLYIYASLNEALRIYEKFNDNKMMEIVLYKIGTAYHALNDYSKSLTYFKRALTLSQEIKDKEGEARITAYLGALQRGKGYLNKPIEY